MPLTLTVIEAAEPQPVPTADHVMADGVSAIGRGQDCDWVLPDPEKILSRKHCFIEYRDGGYYLTDVSAHGVFVNRSAQAVGRDRRVRLNDGDLLGLGKYQVRVAIDATAPPDGGYPRVAPPVNATIIPASLNLDELLASPGQAPPEPPAAIPPELDLKQLFEPPRQRPAPDAIIPEELDWQALLGEAEAPPPPAADNTPADRAFFRPPPIQPEPPPSAEEQPAEEGAAPPAEQPTPPGPTVEPPSQKAPPPSPAPAAAGVELMQAFLTGAGLPVDLPLGGDAGACMRELGFIFRQTVQGLMNILRARYEIKKVIGVRDLTMVGPRENNPIKIAPDVDKAMRILLGPSDPAYLPAAQAITDGFADIKAHEVAMVAGLQDALKYLLQRFDPELLAARLGRSSLLDSVLPAYRKARYWELYTLLYAEIIKEAEDDVWRVFGREFDQAYRDYSRNPAQED